MKKRTKKTINVATKVFTRLLLATVLCAILYVSMNVVGVAFFSDVTGYQVLDTETATVVEQYTFKPGEKTTVDESLLDENQQLNYLREVPQKTKIVLDVISQVLLLVILAIFPYHILWQFGNRDDTNVRYRGQRPDPWRGLKIGLLAMVPFALMWVLLLLSGVGVLPGSFLQIYRLTAFSHYPILMWVVGAAKTATDVSFGRLFLLGLPLLYVPVVCAVSYRLGGRQFSIAEFITFAKKKEETEEEI